MTQEAYDARRAELTDAISKADQERFEAFIVIVNSKKQLKLLDEQFKSELVNQE